MAVRSILEIEVHDEQFRRFTELFAAYSEKLEEQPEVYRKLEEAMAGATGAAQGGAEGAKEAFAMAAAEATLISEAILHSVSAQHELNRSTIAGNHGLADMHKTAQGLGKTLFGVASTILKIGAAGIGIGALGGFFGLGGLAAGAFNRQRDASGLGVSTGTLASFKVNAQEFLGVGALQAAANAQTDLHSAPYFAALGIDPRAAATQSPELLAFDELIKARKAWMDAEKSGNPFPQQAPGVQAYHALGGDINDVRRATQPGALQRIMAARTATLAEAPGLNVSRDQADSMIEFKKQLDRASEAIQKDLLETFAPLAPVLTDLSKDLLALTGQVLGNKDVQEAVKNGAQGLADLLTKTNWKQIGADINTVGSVLQKVGSVLGPLFSLQQPDKSKEQIAAEKYAADDFNTSMQQIGGGFKNAWDFLTHNPLKKIGDGISSAIYNGAPAQDRINIRAAAGDYDATRIAATNNLVSKKYGIPAHLMDRLVADESNYGDPRQMISKAGALGPYQFMPDTAKGYGIDPLDTRQASNASGKMLSDLAKKYGGDYEKVIAAYNMGSAGLDDVLAKHSGKDWLKYTPTETQGEVANVVHGAGGMDKTIADALHKSAKAITAASKVKPPVRVTIHNSSDARVAVQANASGF